MQFLIATTITLAGLAGAYFAKQRGRNPIAWFFIGVFFGLFGVLTLFLLPRLDEPEILSQKITLAETSPANPYDDKEWFYLDLDQQSQGPLTFQQLKEKWKEMSLKRDSFVWTDVMADWQTIGELPLFESILSLT